MSVSLQTFMRSRELVWEMAKRELFGRTKGSLLGHSWHVIVPLIQTAVYIVLVTYIFRADPNSVGGTFSYATYVLTGQIAWMTISKTMLDSTMLIRGQSELVKQVIYPIETLPLTNFLVIAVTSLTITLIALALTAADGALSISVVLLPIPVFLLAILCLGLGWILMIAGVILKDLREMVMVLMLLLAFVSPVVIRESMVPPGLWLVVMLNPLAHVIIAFRDVVFGTWHPVSWTVFVGFTAATFALGRFIVGRMKVVINEYI